MKLLYKNLFWAVASLLALALIFSLIYNPAATASQLSLDQLVAKVNAGEVAKITVRGNVLDIELKDNPTSPDGSGGAKAVAKKEPESGLSETLKNYGVSAEALQKVALSVEDESGFRFWVGILIPTLLPIIAIAIIFWIIFRQARNGASQAFSFGRSNLRLFTPHKNKVSFKDVAGLKEAKEELMEIVEFLKNPQKFLDIGARIPRGVLLMGPPGTGKTLLARAVAAESNVPFFHMSGSELVEMFVGVGASRTRDSFQTAKKAAPSILFIDEIDAVGRMRGAGIGGGHDEREQTLNQILVEMDGFERDTALIVIAATNRPDVLDEALLRPGRFDRRVVLDLPDIKDRDEILKIHAKGKPLAQDIDWHKVAVRTPGFSGADLANLVNEAAILAARQNKKIVEQIHVYSSIEKVLLGPERKGRAITEKDRKITAYHEAGHALIAASLANADPVHKISIVSRGIAGGYTINLPTEENRLRTRSQFVTDLAVMMGGYVAEQEVFGEMSTGASNDLKRASELSRKLVTQFGMSDKLGPMTFGKTQELIFLGREISTEKNYSESVAAEIDKEVKGFISRAYAVAKKIIANRRKVLDAIAASLLEKEVLEQEEFNAIIRAFKLKPIAV